MVNVVKIQLHWRSTYSLDLFIRSKLVQLTADPSNAQSSTNGNDSHLRLSSLQGQFIR